MNDQENQNVGVPAPEGAGLSQLQRLTNTFTAPSKTFEDIKRGNRSWWLPFIIVILCGAFLYTAITLNVTWKGVYENQQRLAPEWAKQMLEKAPPEKRAKAEEMGPKQQAITWALSPLGILLIDLAVTGVLLGTINFGFGGNAKFASIFAVTLYAGLALWPARLVLAGIALFAGEQPESFNIGNPAPTNIGAFLFQQDTPAALYALASCLDVLSIWCLVLTSIGVATVAGVKRNSGYIAVFGWWAIFVLFRVGLAAITG